MDAFLNFLGWVSVAFFLVTISLGTLVVSAAAVAWVAMLTLGAFGYSVSYISTFLGVFTIGLMVMMVRLLFQKSTT